jgi:adenine C2-methylase RlmN of 23S rRNA A2503 and tRNA A37
MKFSIHDKEKLLELFEKNNIKKFRYAQIENAIYKNFIDDFDKIETIPKDLRQLLKDNCFFSSLKVVEEVTSSN